jgi:hypothetical protein
MDRCIAPQSALGEGAPERLTAAEVEVLHLSADLFNAIHALGDHHPSDMEELTRDIHNIQNRVMARVAARSLPGFFNRG